MKPSFQNVHDALVRLSSSIDASVPQAAEFIDIWGWNSPALDKHQISERVDDLAQRVSEIHDEQWDKKYDEWLEGVPAKIDKFITNTLPQLPGGNAIMVIANMEALLTYIEGRLPPQNWPIQWEAAAQAGLLPTKLLRRLRGIEASIAQLEPRAGDLDGKIGRIEDAYTAADNLPTDIQSLEEARNRVASIEADLLDLSIKSKSYVDSCNSDMMAIADRSSEATKLMDNIDSAYRASTSKALADAFAKRSLWLQAQTWIWVVLLIGTLGIGGYAGFHRVVAIEDLLKNNRDIRPSIIWLNVILSFLSVAAPVWFAWVATKQITQRFKLAEDYGFKAAVAKAYEGYRREAANVDQMFVTRLFGSALARLEEAPLRLVDEENYGSPFHELTASAPFREAMRSFPALRDKYKDLLESIGKKTRDSSTAEVPSETENR